jgi:hypothetical protein
MVRRWLTPKQYERLREAWRLSSGMKLIVETLAFTVVLRHQLPEARSYATEETMREMDQSARKS